MQQSTTLDAINLEAVRLLDFQCPATSDHFHNHALGQMLAHWRGLPQQDGVATRQSFDPVDLPSLMGHISLLEVLPAAPCQPVGLPIRQYRFRFRVHATKVANILGQDLTRQETSFFPPLLRQHIEHGFTESIKHRYPAYDRFTLTLTDRRQFVRERLVLPLTQGDGAISHLISVNLAVH